MTTNPVKWCCSYRCGWLLPHKKWTADGALTSGKPRKISLLIWACHDRTIILVIMTCFWFEGWPFCLLIIFASSRREEKLTLAINPMMNLVDWYRDIILHIFWRILPNPYQQWFPFLIFSPAFLYFSWWAPIGVWETWNFQSINTSVCLPKIGPSFSFQVQMTPLAARIS